MLSAEEAYNKHLKTFSAISADKIKTPKMARVDVIGEAEELKVAALEDKDALVKAGCPKEFINTLDERIGAYSHASSVWENSEFAKSEAKKQWMEEEKPAYEFKEQLLHALSHGLRGNPGELKYVKKISAGHGRRDLVLDFKDIAVLGKRNAQALSAIGFDPADLDRAEALHEKLSNLLSEAGMDSEELTELKTLAYQAYTFLEEAVAEIRENGRYVFWKDEERLDLYKSDHYRKIGKTKNREEEKEVAGEIAV
jgi:hypothetical protein